MIPVGPQDATGPGWKICLDCYAWHSDAILALGRGAIPRGCANCQKTMPEIEAAALARLAPLQLPAAQLEQASRKMYLHSLDGIYVLLCGPCSDQVIQLQRFKYQGTPYGAKKVIF